MTGKGVRGPCGDRGYICDICKGFICNDSRCVNSDHRCPGPFWKPKRLETDPVIQPKSAGAVMVKLPEEGDLDRKIQELSLSGNRIVQVLSVPSGFLIVYQEQ